MIPPMEHEVMRPIERAIRLPDWQDAVSRWLVECFGPEIANDVAERNHRFLEESLELVQACGGTAEDAHKLVDYVFNRPIGERGQEVGGVMVTLAALCYGQAIDLDEAARAELIRAGRNIAKIREKQKNKPHASPLPE